MARGVLCGLVDLGLGIGNAATSKYKSVDARKAILPLQTGGIGPCLVISGDLTIAGLVVFGAIIEPVSFDGCWPVAAVMADLPLLALLAAD